MAGFKGIAVWGAMLLTLGGCGSGDGDTSSSSNNPPVRGAEEAIRHEDHTLATEAELLSFAKGQMDQMTQERQTLLDTLYQGIDQPITWNPTHDSITFTTFKPELTHTVLSSNVDGEGKPAVRGLIMMGEQGNQRYGAMGANLFSVRGNPAELTDRLLQNMVNWLSRNAASDGELRVVTAQIPGKETYWFPHNEGIRSWFDEHYAGNYQINEANNCDNEALATCIERIQPHLIILSDLDRKGSGFASIEAALRKAKEQGIPVLLANYQRDPSPLLSPLYLEMGLTGYNNYWSKMQVKDLSVDEIKAQDPSLQSARQLLDDLESGNFDTSVLEGCKGNFLHNCNEQVFVDHFKRGADWFRAGAVSLDQNNKSPFADPSLPLLQSALLLADKYRSSIDYPIEWNEHQAWQQAMFADWVVSYARQKNLTQPDLGEYVIDSSQVFKGSNANYAHPATVSEQKMIGVPYPNQWTTTGWYALPGQTITLTRNDSSPVSVEIKLNYHRSNTNRAYDQHVYLAPLELAQQRLRLAAGQSVTFTTPYGGPIYLYFKGGTGAQQVDMTADGVAKHPTITDFNAPEQIRRFTELLEGTELPHIDLRTEQAEQHLRKDRLLGSLGGEFPDIESLLDAIVNEHVNAVYTLAGFKVQGKSLSESLPEAVKVRCMTMFGEDCVDESLHSRTLIQHANYDQNAHCGSGCSGNPWDASWNISPRGWGDNHELGHNLQVNKLNVQYVIVADRNRWSQYSSRATENSNNIFPYVVRWRTRYINGGDSAPENDGSHKGVFYAFMSDVAGITNASGKRVVLDQNCKQIDAGEDRYTAAWANNAYAFNNNYRMAFYIQMALRADTLQEGTTDIGNGFNIYPLLYLHGRIFDKYAASKELWEENRQRLGFGLFPYDGAALYEGRTVRDMPGNDFMLVSLAMLTKLDWRSHFDLLGLRYSDLAAYQVQAMSFHGSLPMGLYELEHNMPPATMSKGLSFLPLSQTDVTSQWKDGGTPTQCPELP